MADRAGDHLHELAGDPRIALDHDPIARLGRLELAGGEARRAAAMNARG